MHDCYQYSIDAGGRMADWRSYPYVNADRSCTANQRADGMIQARITGIERPRGEAEHLEALTRGAVSVGFKFTNPFFSYGRGIWRDTTCSGSPNHAVTLVGYSPTYVLAKNSWGPHWGISGFVKYARNFGNCQLFEHSSMPILTVTPGAVDHSAADRATDFTVPEMFSEEEDPNCVNDYPDACTSESHCELHYVANDYCQKMCGTCESNKLKPNPNPNPAPVPDGECGNGLTKCADGVCRHSHMCHWGA